MSIHGDPNDTTTWVDRYLAVVGRILHSRASDDLEDETAAIIFCALSNTKTSLSAIRGFLTGRGSSHDERVLRFYGLLSAMYLLQECLRELHTILGTEVSHDISRLENDWIEFRRFRDRALVHPVSRHDRRQRSKIKEVAFLVEHTLDEPGVVVLTWEPATKHTVNRVYQMEQCCRSICMQLCAYLMKILRPLEAIEELSVDDPKEGSNE